MTRGASALRTELARKAIHLATAVVPVAYAGGLPRLWLVWGLASLAAIAVAAELARRRHAPSAELLHRAAGPLLREHERERWTGATWLVIAHLLAVLLLPRADAVTAMWAVSVGDAAGAIVGHAVGRRRFGAAKSLEGSAACLLATLAGALLLGRLPLGAGLLAASAAALAEWPGRPLDDNLRIVLAVGGALALLRALA